MAHITFSMIVAGVLLPDDKLGIGYKGKLPWPKIASDMKRFRELTMGGVLIMGRRTWESLPGVLPGRECLVLSKNNSDFLKVFTSIDAALIHANTTWPEKKIWIIGGQQVYEQVLHQPYCIEAVYITFIKSNIVANVQFDTYFPLLDYSALPGWTLVASEQADGCLMCTYILKNERKE